MQGDLAYNTSDNALKYYTGSAWASITAGIGNVVEDNTPQLGGNLDLNSNDITGTGQIDISHDGGTGTVTATNTTGPQFQAKYSANQWLALNQSGAASYIRSRNNSGDGEIVLQGGYTSKTRMIVRTNGDIDFYNADGTTKKMEWDATANALEFEDNAKAVFGAGNDLQIYHDSNDSYINDTGSGNLRLAGSANVEIISSGGEFMAKFVADGAATLYHNNSAKIATTSSGVDVTGTAVVDALTCSGTTTIEGTSNFGTSSGDTRFNFDGPNQYRAVFKSSGTIGGQIGAAGADDLRFSNAAGATTASIKDGNLLVGKTASGIANNGIELRANNDVLITKDGATALYLNRKSSDGEIIEFRKDGTGVGVIGTQNWGIGTASPNEKLTIDSGALSFLGSLSTPSIGAGIFRPANNTLAFVTGSSERARFDAYGSFLIGRTSAGFTSETGTTIGPGFIQCERNGTLGFYNRTTDGTLMDFRRSNSTKGSISANSSGVTYNTTSDIRLKQDIEPLVATDKLMAMNPVSYNWKADPDGPRSMGFIAQEMQEVMPEAVSTGDGDDAMMSMDYGRITPILVSALQDAHRKIEQLEQRIAEMEAK
jgi:hypothetical protein